MRWMPGATSMTARMLCGRHGCDDGSMAVESQPTREARRTPLGGATVAVRDTGVGIDPASLARIFDPFFTKFDVSRHASGTFEFDRRGLGLGLAVVKAFVEMHGGTVRPESQLGQGTTFTIELPPVRSEAGERAVQQVAM